eukprot:g6039.t1
MASRMRVVMAKANKARPIGASKTGHVYASEMGAPKRTETPYNRAADGFPVLCLRQLLRAIRDASKKDTAKSSPPNAEKQPADAQEGESGRQLMPCRAALERQLRAIAERSALLLWVDQFACRPSACRTRRSGEQRKPQRRRKPRRVDHASHSLGAAGAARWAPQAQGPTKPHAASRPTVVADEMQHTGRVIGGRRRRQAIARRHSSPRARRATEGAPYCAGGYWARATAELATNGVGGFRLGRGQKQRAADPGLGAAEDGSGVSGGRENLGGPPRLPVPKLHPRRGAPRNSGLNAEGEGLAARTIELNPIPMTEEVASAPRCA